MAAHDPGSTAPVNTPEPGAAEGRRDPGPDKHVGSGLVRFSRIAFEDSSAFAPCIVNRGAEQLKGQPAPARSATGEEADNGPDRPVVNPRPCPVPVEHREFFPGTETAPGDRFSAEIAQQPGNPAGLDDAIQRAPVARATAAAPFLERETIEHAPAAHAGAFGAEQIGQVLPALRRDRPDRESRSSSGAGRGQSCRHAVLFLSQCPVAPRPTYRGLRLRAFFVVRPGFRARVRFPAPGAAGLLRDDPDGAVASR